MALTPSRNPLPRLNQNKGVTGTFPAGDTVTVKDGAVQSVTPAASTPSNNSDLLANAPLNKAGNTLTIQQATDSADGYLGAVDHTTFSHLATYGNLVDRPVTPDVPAGTMAFYGAADVPALYVWMGSWMTICLCNPSSSSSSSNSSSSSSM